MKGKAHYEQVLNELVERKTVLQEKRSSFDEQIRDIDSLIAGLGKVYQPRKKVSNGNVEMASTVSENHASKYADMGVVEAVIEYLKTVHSPQKTRHIVATLENGGYPHKSKNFYGTVYALLHRRAKTHKDVRLIDSKWALSEWFEHKQ